MDDSTESSVFEALIGLLNSPIAKKIGDVFGVGEELETLGRARGQNDVVVNGGLSRSQRRLVAYEDEDLLHDLMIAFAADSMDFGEEEEEKESERYEFEFEANSL